MIKRLTITKHNINKQNKSSLVSFNFNRIIKTHFQYQILTIHFIKDKEEIINSLKVVNLLLLDFDDTLVDYHKAESKALLKLFTNYNIRNVNNAIQDYKKINDEIWMELENGYKTVSELRSERFDRFQKLYPMNKDSMDLDLEYRNYFVEYTLLYENVKSSLNNVREIGIKSVIVSNGFTDTQNLRIKKVGINHLIDGIITSEGAGRAKPDTLMLKRALALVNMQKNRCWLVGDSLRSDISAANKFKINSCLVGEYRINLTEHPCPSITAGNFFEFTQLLIDSR